MAQVFRLSGARRVLRTLAKMGRAFAPLILAPQATPPARTRSKSARGAQAGRAATFTKRHFDFQGTRHIYWLFVPSSRARPEPPPVLMMLHGCKQDAEDFARGTAMNALAEREGCIVVYPEQSAKANGMRCWNWFETRHQQRDAGEPAMLAALARRVCTREKGDPQRLYVAGLSAGGAMTSVLAQRYPDVFAAAGIHSGLAHGAAHDVLSAMRAMRVGVDAAHEKTESAAVPTFVIHGAADRTVNPRNGVHLIESLRKGFAAEGDVLVARKSVVAGGSGARAQRKASRTRYVDAQGHVQLEFWDVDDAPHAWSGGDAAGSFTDPSGPDASSAMLDFMLAHRLRAAAQRQRTTELADAA